MLDREEAKARIYAADAALARLEELSDEDWVREDTAERMRGAYGFRKRRFAARFDDEDDGAIEERSLRLPAPAPRAARRRAAGRVRPAPGGQDQRRDDATASSATSTSRTPGSTSSRVRCRERRAARRCGRSSAASARSRPDVVLVLGCAAPPGRRLPGKTGWSTIRPASWSSLPDASREREVGRVVAMDVADLARADRERELAARAVAGLDAGPRRDLVGDLLACGRVVVMLSPCRDSARYKFK